MMDYNLLTENFVEQKLHGIQNPRLCPIVLRKQVLSFATHLNRSLQAPKPQLRNHPQSFTLAVNYNPLEG